MSEMTKELLDLGEVACIVHFSPEVTEPRDAGPKMVGTLVPQDIGRPELQRPETHGSRTRGAVTYADEGRPRTEDDVLESGEGGEEGAEECAWADVGAFGENEGGERGEWARLVRCVGGCVERERAEVHHGVKREGMDADARAEDGGERAVVLVPRRPRAFILVHEGDGAYRVGEMGSLKDEWLKGSATGGATEDDVVEEERRARGGQCARSEDTGAEFGAVPDRIEVVDDLVQDVLWKGRQSHCFGDKVARWEHREFAHPKFAYA
jgi:hypothetical protein